MKTQSIIRTAGLSSASYNRIVEDYFVKYCDLWSGTQMHLQLLLTDKALQNWFSRQVAQAEANYLNLVARHPNLKQPAALNLLHGQLHGIFSKYAKSILQPAGKTARRIDHIEILTLLN